jgi:hypothetical protein
MSYLYAYKYVLSIYCDSLALIALEVT